MTGGVRRGAVVRRVAVRAPVVRAGLWAVRGCGLGDGEGRYASVRCGVGAEGLVGIVRRGVVHRVVAVRAPAVRAEAWVTCRPGSASAEVRRTAVSQLVAGAKRRSLRRPVGGCSLRRGTRDVRGPGRAVAGGELSQGLARCPVAVEVRGPRRRAEGESWGAQLRTARCPRPVLGRQHAQGQPDRAAVLREPQRQRYGRGLPGPEIGQCGRGGQGPSVGEGELPGGRQPGEPLEALLVGDHDALVPVAPDADRRDLVVRRPGVVTLVHRGVPWSGVHGCGRSRVARAPHDLRVTLVGPGVPWSGVHGCGRSSLAHVPHDPWGMAVRPGVPWSGVHGCGRSSLAHVPHDPWGMAVRPGVPWSGVHGCGRSCVAHVPHDLLGPEPSDEAALKTRRGVDGRPVGVGRAGADKVVREEGGECRT
ncbi:hypothetical protein EDD94_6339 [Streptomyces sp. PanSC9]|nr:hypothetical protein EDD94_6339 [Streptomyces sp. PanSC9]